MLLLLLVVYAIPSCFAVNMTQNISFDLSLMYDQYKSCTHYFGNTSNTINTLGAMNTIFSSTWQLYSDIISPPQTILSDGYTFINCSKSQNIILSRSHFTVERPLHLHYSDSFSQFSVASSMLLKIYFNDSIDLLVYIPSQLQNTSSNTIFHWRHMSLQYNVSLLLSLLLMGFLCVVAVTCYVKRQYDNAFVVDKALVLIIGISQFDDKRMFLPGVKKNIDDLIQLWENKYHYEVAICNNSTLYCTKQEVIDFIDENTEKLQQDPTYNAIIVHVISHGSTFEFVTSDMKRLSATFIAHEVKESCNVAENLGAIKLIFYHCGRGADVMDSYDNINTVLQKKEKKSFSCCSCNVRICPDNSVDIDNQTMSVDSNSVVIYGNIEGRALSDSGSFTQCICESFEKNLQRIFKKDFESLIKDIGRKLERVTNCAEIVDTSGFGTLRYNQIRFACAPKTYAENNQKYAVIDKPTVNMYDEHLVQEIIRNENDYRQYRKIT